MPMGAWFFARCGVFQVDPSGREQVGWAESLTVGTAQSSSAPRTLTSALGQQLRFTQQQYARFMQQIGWAASPDAATATLTSALTASVFGQQLR
jgi:hypothetical protein